MLMKRIIVIALAGAAGAGCALWTTQSFPTFLFKIGSSRSHPGVRELAPSPDMPVFRSLTPEETANSANLDQLIKSRLANLKSEDPANDFQRYNVIRAAITYVYSPCTEFPKKELVQSITEYVDAYRRMLGCGQTDRICSHRHMELAWRAFHSDFDSEVRSAINEAYYRGGLSTADFPTSMTRELGVIAGLRETKPLTCEPPQHVPAVPRTP